MIHRYEGIFAAPVGRIAAEEFSIRVVVFDESEEKITQWIE